MLGWVVALLLALAHMQDPEARLNVCLLLCPQACYFDETLGWMCDPEVDDVGALLP